jgi:hypothetical protein
MVPFLEPLQEGQEVVQSVRVNNKPHSFHPADESSKIPRKADILLHHNTSSQPRKPRLESSSPCKPQMLQKFIIFQNDDFLLPVLLITNVKTASTLKLQTDCYVTASERRHYSCYFGYPEVPGGSSSWLRRHLLSPGSQARTSRNSHPPEQIHRRGSTPWQPSGSRQILLEAVIRLSHLQTHLNLQCTNCKSHDSSVGIAISYGLDDRGSRVRFPAGAGNFLLHHREQNGSGAHPASYPMGTRALPLEVKRPGREADHLNLVREAIPPLPNTPSWCRARFKKSQGQLYLYLYINSKSYWVDHS